MRPFFRFVCNIETEYGTYLIFPMKWTSMELLSDVSIMLRWSIFISIQSRNRNFKKNGGGQKTFPNVSENQPNEHGCFVRKVHLQTTLFTMVDKKTKFFCQHWDILRNTHLFKTQIMLEFSGLSPRWRFSWCYNYRISWSS